MQKKVGVVLVNYNGEPYICGCLESLLAQTYQNLEILFWDNHSDDDSVKIIKKMYPQIHLVESQYNYGFAKANNLAAKLLLKLGVEYLLLLNVDTVADTFLVERLLEKADSRTVTTAQISMGRHGENVWYSGGELLFDNGNARQFSEKYCKENRRVTFISGCCMMIHKDIIKRYGLFDNNYYMYYEDTDLCMRWYLNGIHMYCVPTAKLWHKIGGSSVGIVNPQKEYYKTRNRLYFINKYNRYMKTNTVKVLFEIIKKIVMLPEVYNIKMIRAVCLGISDYVMKKMCKSNYRF